MFKMDFLEKLLNPKKRTNRVSICSLCGAIPETPGKPIGTHKNVQTGESCNGNLILIPQEPEANRPFQSQSSLHRNRGPFC